jgi:hypothetical protein
MTLLKAISPSFLMALDDNIVWNEAEGNYYADGNPYKGAAAVLNCVFTRLGAEGNFRLAGIKLHVMADD